MSTLLFLIAGRGLPVNLSNIPTLVRALPGKTAGTVCDTSI